MIFSRFWFWFYNLFKPKEIADIEFIKLGYSIYEQYPNKLIYRKRETIENSAHYIQIRFNLANQIHIESYDDNYFSYRMNLYEIDAALIKVHEMIKERKEENAKYDTRIR